MPKLELKNSSKINSSDLISKKTSKSDPKKKRNRFLVFAGLLLLSYGYLKAKS